MHLLAQSSRRFLRRHPGQLLLALAGIAAGVAVITGVALLREVLIDTLEVADADLTGQPSVRIVDPSGRLDESRLVSLATRPGAPALVPVLRETIEHDDRPVALIGTDVVAFAAGREAVVNGSRLIELMQSERGVAVTGRTLARLGRTPGDRLAVQINGRARQLEIVAQLPPGRGLDDRLVTDIATAQHLLGRAGELSWIAAPADSADWLRRELPASLQLITHEQAHASRAGLTAGMRANLDAMSLIALAVGLFVLYAVLSFLLIQRRRTFGMLRAVGVTSARIGRLLQFETAVLAGLGALAGLVLGTWLADGLLALVHRPVARLYDVAPAAGVAPRAGPYIVIWLLAVGAAVAATTSLWNEARRIPPGPLGRRFEPAPRGRLRHGLSLALIAAGALVIVSSDGLYPALGGQLLALIGLAGLAPACGIWLLGRAHRLCPGTLAGRALGMLTAARRRIGPALAALSLALALAAGIGMMVMGFRIAVDDWIDRMLRAEVYVAIDGGDIGPALAADVAGIDGVEAVSSTRLRTLSDDRRLIAYDLPPQAWAGFEWLAGDGAAAQGTFTAGRAALVSEPYARRHGVAPGDEVHLPAPGGELQLPVAAVYRDYASERGRIAIAGSLYRRHWNDDEFDSLGIYPAAPGDRGDRLIRALHALDSRLNVTGREDIRRQTLAVFDRTFRISWALALLVGLIAGIALISALLALGLERRRDYATLRALGLSRRGLAAVVLTQTTGLAAAALVLAVPMSLAIHVALAQIIQPRAFGWSLPLSWPLAPIAIGGVVALIAGALAGLYPAWRIARQPPITGLRRGP